jgi:O-antigen/teichoic acid export membrane protein
MPDPGAEPGKPPAPGRRTFLINALSSYGQTTLIALSALLLTPYLFRQLGEGGFGTWSVMFTLITVFNMVETGFAQATTKFIAEHRATGESGEAEATLGASVILDAGFGVIALAVSVALAFFATGLAADGDADAYRQGMLILGVAFLVRSPFLAHGAALAGYQRYDLYGIGEVVMVLGSAIGTVVLVEAGVGVLGVAIAYAVAFAAEGVCYPILLRYLDRGLRLVPRAADRGARRTVLSFSSFTLLADSMLFIGSRLDTVVIAALRSASAAAPFAAAYKLQSGLQALTMPVIRLMMPMSSDLAARGMRDTLIDRTLIATRVTLQVTAPLALAFAFFSADIVDVWLGASAPSVTAGIITVLSLHTLLLCGVPAQRVLTGLGHARVVGIRNTVWGLSNLGFSIVLVYLYGAIGAAIGTLLAASLVAPVFFPISCRLIGFPLSRLLREGLWPAVASTIPSVVLMVPVWLLFSPGAGRLLLGLTLAVSAAALVGLLQVGPRRSVSEIRRGLGEPEPEAGGALVVDLS